MRTVPGIDLLMQPIEEATRHQLLPALTGRHGITDLKRELLALPARHGGLGIVDPTNTANNQFKACTEVTAPLVELICQRNPNYPEASQIEQRKLKVAHRTKNRRATTKEVELLKPKLQRARQRAMEKGAMPSIRHNPVRDITAQLLTEVCPKVGVEPTLQLLNGESFPFRSTNTEDACVRTFVRTAQV